MNSPRASASKLLPLTRALDRRRRVGYGPFCSSSPGLPSARYDGSLRTTRRTFRSSLASLLLSALILLVLGVSSALATSLAPVSPYGEVGRFGGYQVPTGPGNGLGKFVYPVGFAVAPAEDNDIYVLDRIQDEKVGTEVTLDYRLQKLSSAGVPIASVTLPLEKYEETVTEENEEPNINANPLVSLAVDSAKDKVYALVEGMVNSEEAGETDRIVPVAQRLVAWSTQPNGKTLEKASGYPEDKLTGAALIAGETVLQSANVSEDLYAPSGLTVDPANDNVVIEAQQGVSNSHGGPTILQRVITNEGTGKEGVLGEDWVAGSEHNIAPSNEQADGIFTANDGSLGIDLFEEYGNISRLADVKPTFSKAEPTLLAEDKSGGINRDEAPTIDNAHTVNYDANNGGQFNNAFTTEPYTAGSPIAQLTNGLYAARYALREEGAGNEQTMLAPWENGGLALTAFWTQGVEGVGVGNIGIRIFGSKGEVVTTIGGQSAAPCNIDNAALSVAAGSSETLFVLTQPNAREGNSGDEVIEFAPGASGKCPEPSGSLTVNGKPVAAGDTVTVDQSVPASFDAFSIDRAGESPFEFDWKFENEATGGTAGTNDGYDLGSKIEGPQYLWPNPTSEHTYAAAGEYNASLRVIGDYGTSVFPFKVKVLGTKRPVATFTVSASPVENQPVEFNAAASTPNDAATEGSVVSTYDWEFGDEASEITSSPQTKHEYAKAGTYEVKLVVTDDETGQSSEAFPFPVTVAEATKACTENCGGTNNPGGGGTTTTPTTTTPLVTPPPVKPFVPPVKPLTKAQELAKALKACAKEPKKRRAGCVKQAEKKYAPKKSKKKKKK
jgi:PKD domain